MKKILISGILGLALIGCDITTTDQASLTPTLALNTIAGVQSVVLSGYRRMHEFDFYGQQASLHGDALADNIEIVNRTGRYEQEWINGVGVFANRWAVCYRAINDANFVFEYLPQQNLAFVPSTVAFPSQQVMNHIEGEAHFIRAFAYMELLRVYAYEPGKEVNGFNLGVVIRDTPTQVVSDADKRSRSTNLECYEFVEQDLLDAIALLAPASQFTIPGGGGWPASLGANTFPFRATKGAAHALLARLYLYWGRYAEANTQATIALTLVPTAAPMTAATYAASWSSATHPESIFEIELRATDWSGVDGANNSLHSMTQNAISGSQYVMAASAELISAHEGTDVRRTVYVTTAGKPQVRKWQGEKGSYLENIPVIRRSEMYLIQAESLARQGGQDAAAQTAINTIRTNRGLTTTTATGTALIALIMNERRVELAFEGHRWFDLKRNGMAIPKPAASSVTALAYNDFRILQQIPNAEVTLNPSLQQNPGY